MSLSVGVWARTPSLATMLMNMCDLRAQAWPVPPRACWTRGGCVLCTRGASSQAGARRGVSCDNGGATMVAPLSFDIKLLNLMRHHVLLRMAVSVSESGTTSIGRRASSSGRPSERN
jgi:hypothetical protein